MYDNECHQQLQNYLNCLRIHQKLTKNNFVIDSKYLCKYSNKDYNNCVLGIGKYSHERKEINKMLDEIYEPPDMNS